MRNKSKFCFFFIALWCISVLALISTISTVQAQERKNLFDLLFGSKQNTPQALPKNNNNPTRSKPINKAPKKTKPVVISPAMQPQIEKNANAKKILFIGDFVASAMSDGLNEIYADNINYRIIKRTDGSSGLVRLDHYNWHDNISKIINEENADIIIFVIGANDKQSIKIDRQTIEFNSEEWNKIYQERVAQVVKDLEATQKPWLWVGLPSFGKPQLHQSSGRLNAYYNAAISNTKGQFIDIWSGFVDDKGGFALSGYDMNGQTARLRNNDGISFTPAGRQKLAFYVKAPIEAIFETNTNAPVTEPITNDSANLNSSEENSTSNILPTSSKKVALPQKRLLHIPPMNLTDLPNKASELGGANPRGDIELQRQHIYEEQKGRADYFGVH